MAWVVWTPGLCKTFFPSRLAQFETLFILTASYERERTLDVRRGAVDERVSLIWGIRKFYLKEIMNPFRSLSSRNPPHRSYKRGDGFQCKKRVSGRIKKVQKVAISREIFAATRQTGASCCGLTFKKVASRVKRSRVPWVSIFDVSAHTLWHTSVKSSHKNVRQATVNFFRRVQLARENAASSSG